MNTTRSAHTHRSDTPLFDDDLRLLQAVEDLLVQTLVTKLAVERLAGMIKSAGYWLATSG